MVYDLVIPLDIFFNANGALEIAETDFQAHSTNTLMKLVGEKFGETVISRNGAVSSPPRSCDLRHLY